MERLRMTHSLLSSWLYAMKENPYEDASTEGRDKFEEFLQILRREPTETTPAMQDGIEFESLVDAISHGGGNPEHKWFIVASRVADIIKNGAAQVNASRDVPVGDRIIHLHGRLDWLKAGEIIDTKFSKSYSRGKYFDSTQHPMYFEIVPEASTFTYVISDGTDVWTEAYRRDETRSIIPICADFLAWLDAHDLFDVYRQFWVQG